eukprot:UN00036
MIQCLLNKQGSTANTLRFRYVKLDFVAQIQKSKVYKKINYD